MLTVPRAASQAKNDTQDLRFRSTSPFESFFSTYCNRASESLCRMKWRLKWMITGKPSITQESLLWFCLCVQPEGKRPAMPMKHCFVLWTRQNKGLVTRSSHVSCKGQQQRQIPPWHFRSVAQSITNSGYSRIFHCLSKKCHLAQICSITPLPHSTPEVGYQSPHRDETTRRCATSR